MSLGHISENRSLKISLGFVHKKYLLALVHKSFFNTWFGLELCEE